MVTSMVIVDACPDSKKLDSKLATREIDELVGPCKKVPGGAAHFSATLQPGTWTAVFSVIDDQGYYLPNEPIDVSTAIKRDPDFADGHV